MPHVPWTSKHSPSAKAEPYLTGKESILNMYSLHLTVFSLYFAQGLYDIIFQQAYVYKGT